MRVKLFALLGVIFVPLCVSGQSSDSPTPVFYNKGKMGVYGSYEKGNASSSGSMYIQGSLVADRDSEDPDLKSDIYLEKSKVILTGDLVQKAGFVKIDPAGSSDLSNLASGGHAFSLPDSYAGKESLIVFKGNQEQKILMGVNGYDSRWKGAHYINFPDIEVNNSKHVSVAPEVAVSVKAIDLSKGRLQLKSRGVTSGDVGGSAIHTAETSSLLAHLYVDSNSESAIKYNRTDDKTSVDEFGAIEVQVAALSKVKGTENYEGANRELRNITAMGSPFKEIKADYFMYNFVMIPSGTNLLGQWNFSNPNPDKSLKAGEGFVVGIDLRGTDAGSYDDMDENFASKISFADRVTGVDDNNIYKFSRFAYNNKNNIYPTSRHIADNKFTRVNPSAHAAYTSENLTFTNVQRSLVKGFNYLSNPFSTPLDLSDLINFDNPSAAKTNWGVDLGEAVGDILPYVWVLNPSSTAFGYHSTYHDAGYLKASYTYFLMKQEGGTYHAYSGTDYTNREDLGVDGNDAIIAPLQMFLVYGLKNTAITIPAKARSIESSAQFLRSTSNKVKRDDFVFEVVDKKTKAYDRTAVVLRSKEDIMSNSAYVNVNKTVSSVVSDSDDVNSKSAALRLSTAEGVVSNTINSVIYTKDAMGKALESNFLPKNSTEVSTDLFISPSSTGQEISISAKRLYTMKDVTAIWLDDKLRKTSFELSTGKEYVAEVKPSDKHDRFTLRFVFGTSGIGEEANTANDIFSHYADGKLTVGGFDSSDMNSMISVYDVQGRLLKQAKVNQLTMVIEETFYPGAYIVKVVGNNKSYVSKFLAR